MISLINHSYLLVIDLRILWKKQKKLRKNKLKNMGVPKYQIFFRKKNDSLEWDLFVYVTLGRWWWGIHLLINHLQTSQLSRFHRVSQGFSAFLMVPQFFIGSSFLMGLQILSWFLPKLSFLKKKQTYTGSTFQCCWRTHF